jgi:hypothetical protein
MGAGQSVPGSIPKKGLHVLRVAPGSPASQTDLEPFFDFIVGYEDPSNRNQAANIEAHDFERVVEEHEGKKLELLVWSNKGQSVRREFLYRSQYVSINARSLYTECATYNHLGVSIFPSRKWSLTTVDDDDDKTQTQPSLLGLSMRVCEPEFSLGEDNQLELSSVLHYLQYCILDIARQRLARLRYP